MGKRGTPIFIGRLSRAVAFLFALTNAALAGEPYDAATKSAIKDIITHQLDAFAHEDAKAAEAFAAPGIRARFPEPAQFFDMVKKNYGALVHPKSAQFGEIASSPHGPLQKMTIIAADGTVWTAVYVLQQIDGTWRISGCGLLKVEGQQDI